MSWRAYSTSLRPCLRHHCEPSPHPEALSFPLPPLKRAYEDKNYFVRSSSAEGKVFDLQGEVKSLSTAKSVPETSIEWLNTSPKYLDSSQDQQAASTFGDFNPFRCRPFVACCCAAYSCCTFPNVCHEHFASSTHRDPTGPNDDYFVSQTLDNILLPPNFARMAYERDRCNIGAPAENYDDDDDDDDSATRRTAGVLSVGGICSQGEENAGEIRDSNVQMNVDGVHVGSRSRLARAAEFKTEKETFQRGEESSKKTRQLGEFCESETSDEERKGKRFRSDTNSVRNFKTTVHNVERSWQKFRPVVYNCKRTHPYSKMDLRPKANGFFNVDDSQNEIGAFGIRTKERVSSKESFHQVQSCSSTSGSPGDVKMSSHDACVSGMQGRLEVASARFPSFEMGRASENTRARKSETTSTNDPGAGFISLDSTKSAFMTLMKKMKAQPDAMLCPYCSQLFAQYPDLKKHVQTHNNFPRASDDSGVPEVGGHKGHPVEPADDEGSKRATSVIMFAGQKK